jgi:dethiobiotin synthetase
MWNRGSAQIKFTMKMLTPARIRIARGQDFSLHLHVMPGIAVRKAPRHKAKHRGEFALGYCRSTSRTGGMKPFLTGTDTDVGKTYVAARLVRALRRAGQDAVGMKPLCCGGREDAEALREAAENSIELNEVNPVWLRAPAAPYTAAMIEGRNIDLALIRETFARLRGAHGSLIVEGVGGWRVPITRDFAVSDLAAEFALPVAVVVANRLGAINHTLLTVESIRAAGLVCAGLILNRPREEAAPDMATATNRAVLEDLLSVPVLAEVGCGDEEISLTGFARWMAR